MKCVHSSRLIVPRSSLQVMESACLVFLCILFVSGSGLEYVVHNDPQKSVSLLFKLIKTHEGPLDPSYKSKVTNSVCHCLCVQNLICLSSYMYKGLKVAQNMREFGRQLEDCQGEYVYLFPLGGTKSCYCSLVFNAILGLLCFKRDLPKWNVGSHRN